jgi:urease accessory protein
MMSSHEPTQSDLLVLQLADSSFPLGGFAFSYGLESMAHLGRIKDVSQFRKYLDNVVVQLSWSDVPFINSTHGCQEGAHEEAASAFEWYDAFCTIPGIRKGSISQGRSLLQIMRNLYPELPFAEIHGWITRRGIQFHFTPLFGMCCRLIGLCLDRTVTTYLYMSVRDQVASAVRLGMLGPQQSQSILKEVLDRVPEIVSRSRDRVFTQACKTAPMLEIAQAHHPRLYSRLFRN